jgi:hypothetical protein
VEPDDLLVQAGRLIAFGLRPRAYPGAIPEYRVLVARYRTDHDFQRTVDAVAEGLGLTVLDATQLGFYLGATPESRFAYSLADFRRERGASTFDDRVQHGLALAAIAAYFYPQATDLAQETHREARVSQVERFLRSACEELRKTWGDADPRVDQPEFERAWRLYVRQKETASTADGRRAQRGTLSVIARTFELLAEAGLVRRARDDADPAYQPLERFRLQVAGLAGKEAYEALADIARIRDGEAAG